MGNRPGEQAVGDTGEGPRWGRRRIQDWAALVCLSGGMAGLLATAFAWHPLAGVAVLSVLLIGVGVYAGME
jgi:hypothetical protein